MFVISLSTFLIRTEQIIFHCVHLDHTSLQTLTCTSYNKRDKGRNQKKRNWNKSTWRVEVIT